MAPQKKKGLAETFARNQGPHQSPPHDPLSKADPQQIQDITQQTEAHGQAPVSVEVSAELTKIALQLKALEKKKEMLEKQLATRQRAVDQKQQLADANCKVAAMQEEVIKLQKACGNIPEASSHQEEHNNYRQITHLQEEIYPQPINLPLDQNSPLSIALQRTPWPFGYKPT